MKIICVGRNYVDHIKELNNNIPENPVIFFKPETSLNESPIFEVNAVGAFKQNPGCPEFSLTSLDPDRLEKLCGGECYNPSDERKLISKIFINICTW